MLLESGLPFSDCISLSFQNGHNILDRLEKGASFGAIVKEQKGARMKQLGTLMELFDLQRALEFDSKLLQARKSTYGTLFQKSGYPLFIMAFATALIWFFSCSIVPAMAGEGGGSNMILSLLQIASLLFWSVIVCALAMIGWMIFLPSLSSGAGRLLFRLSWLRYLCSMECAVLFECAHQAGMSTRQISHLVEESRSFPFCRILFQKWSRQIEKGVSLNTCILKDRRLDSLFVRFFEIGLSGSRIEQMMHAYQKSSTLVFERQLSHISSTLLYTAYGFVGVLALSLYQIMLEPLEMLEAL